MISVIFVSLFSQHVIIWLHCFIVLPNSLVHYHLSSIQFQVSVHIQFQLNGSINHSVCLCQNPLSMFSFHLHSQGCLCSWYQFSILCSLSSEFLFVLQFQFALSSSSLLNFSSAILLIAWCASIRICCPHSQFCPHPGSHPHSQCTIVPLFLVP